MLGVLFLSIFLTACAEVEKKPLAFETSQVDSMAFQFENSIRFNEISLPVEEISREVIKNLQQWGYVFKSEDYTHDLKISIGSINRSSTPFGLSFSAGNSNPRSLNFQKSSTFPLTCSLMPKGQFHRAELVMTVMADSYVILFNKPKGQDKAIEMLTDDISTVCYNLLSSLNIKAKELISVEKSTQPRWVPEIRIEVENKDKSGNQNIKETRYINNKKEESRRIIIHNQGNPVIFKFGSDRK